MNCLNGCHDLDFFQDPNTVTVCTCTPEEILKAVQWYNSRGISVLFSAGPTRDMAMGRSR